jgi:hypothetical protein
MSIINYNIHANQFKSNKLINRFLFKKKMSIVNYNLKFYNIIMYIWVDFLISLFSRILYDLFHHPGISSIEYLFICEIFLIYLYEESS